MATIEQLQDSTTNYRDEEKRLKQLENERNEKDLTVKMNHLKQVNVYSSHCSPRKTPSRMDLDLSEN